MIFSRFWSKKLVSVRFTVSLYLYGQSIKNKGNWFLLRKPLKTKNSTPNEYYTRKTLRDVQEKSRLLEVNWDPKIQGFDGSRLAGTLWKLNLQPGRWDLLKFRALLLGGIQNKYKSPGNRRWWKICTPTFWLLLGGDWKIMLWFSHVFSKHR